jgi:tripeptide aminopeptidase
MPRYKTSCVERFLRYVTYDTQSEDRPDRFPSTEKQLVLLRLLADELKAIGLKNVQMDAHGYVMGTIPATTTKANVPAIGFIAHVDTSPESSGENVKPLVHRDYKGQDIVLPDNPAVILKASEDPELAKKIGEDIITASGLTLLGSDDKAGVAEIVGAAEFFIQNPQIPHGDIHVGFTPDEEVGRGADFFDVQRFGARFAYTMDGGRAGELNSETFSADTMILTFRGFNTHPGYAKGEMINSIKMVSAFIERLPKDRLSPETTSHDEGYVHPYMMTQVSVDQSVLRVLLRDFTEQGLSDKAAFLKTLASEVAALFPGSRIETEVKSAYRNMKEIINQHPEVIAYAREAIQRVGLAPLEDPIRGGTDGSRLSFMGLPCANIFAGQHQIHSRKEWTTIQDMERAVDTIIELCQIWEQRA